MFLETFAREVNPDDEKRVSVADEFEYLVQLR